jgi:hypothetical protein
VIGPDYIQAAGGLVGLQTTVTGGDDIRIWAGHVSAASAPFRVYESGLLVASNAIIEGTIEAQSGSIGGWAITASTFQSVLTGTIGITLDSQNAIIEVGDSAGTYIEIDGFNRRIRSSNFATGATGFNIDADTGDAEFNNITARGELKTFLLTSSNQMAVGGSIIVSQDSGKLGADVSSGATTVNFGKAMTTGDWIKIQGPDSAGSNALEWMLIGSNVSGFTYNVTRNVDGSGANNWLKDTPFVVIGASGDSRIEIVAGASGSIQLITQGAAWNTQTVQASMSTVAGAITAGGGDITLDSIGILIDNSTTSGFAIKDDAGNRNTIHIVADALNDLEIVNIAESPAGLISFFLKIDGSNTPAFRLTTTGTFFNPNKEDVDFLIGGTGATSVVKLDAGQNRLGIGDDHFFPTRESSSPNGTWNTANQDMDFTFEGTTGDIVKMDAGLNALIVSKISNGDGLAAGTYAPTCTAVANIDATSAVADFTYMRVGNSVLVSGNMNSDATAAGAVTRVRVTLPVASNFTSTGDLTGTGGIEGADDVVIALADTTNDAADVRYTANGTANTVIRIMFMYVVK